MDREKKDFYAFAIIKEKNKPVVVYIEKKVIKPEDFLNAVEEDDPSRFWQSFPIPNFIQLGHPTVAIKEIIRVLKDCKEIDHEKYIQFHKGNPYYWLGVSHFIIGDFQSASFFMNAAVREDINRKSIPSPATDFIELRGESEKQAAKQLVEFAELKLKNLIDSYNSFLKSSGDSNQFSVEDVREWFLKRATKPDSPKLQTLATTLISFILEHDQRMIQLGLVQAPTSIEPFILHLFKGCLLLESLLKENPLDPQKTPKQTLGNTLQNLHNLLGIKNDIQTGADNFQDVIDLLSKFDNSLNMAFEISTKVRNTAGHSLGWKVILSQKQYQKLFEIIGHCCLHSIIRLYKD